MTKVGVGLDAALAERFSALTLGHLDQEYPHKLDHVMNSADDAATPAALHPIFFGSFDWHSCVHGWWQVLRLLRLFPDNPFAKAVRNRADAMLTPAKVAVEVVYLNRPGSGGFERPYGWAWTLALHDEATCHRAPWGEALAPLAHAFADRFTEYLPKLTYPIRHGAHGNTAFALLLALDWARSRDVGFARLIASRSRDWFLADRGCQAWEPGGDDFLSPSLIEAALMSRVLDRREFVPWFNDFLPMLHLGEPATLFTPATVSDRGDGKIAHLDGLNLSRAWCWRLLATALGDDHPITGAARQAVGRHIDASLPHIADDYMGTHWLATFALLALL